MLFASVMIMNLAKLLTKNDKCVNVKNACKRDQKASRPSRGLIVVTVLYQNVEMIVDAVTLVVDAEMTVGAIFRESHVREIDTVDLPMVLDVGDREVGLARVHRLHENANVVLQAVMATRHRVRNRR